MDEHKPPSWDGNKEKIVVAKIVCGECGELSGPFGDDPEAFVDKHVREVHGDGRIVEKQFVPMPQQNSKWTN